MTELVQINNQIRSGQPPPPLALDCEEESYYISRLEGLVVENYIPKEGRMTQLIVYFGSGTTALEVPQQVQIFSMFAPKRLIVLYDAQDLRKGSTLKKPYGIAELICDVITLAEGTALFILYHDASPVAAKKDAQVLRSQVAPVESAPVRRDNELREAVIQVAKGLDLELAPQATPMLIERAGYDLETFYSELQELSIPAKGAGGLVSCAMVQQVASKSYKYDPYDLLGAVQ